MNLTLPRWRVFRAWNHLGSSGPWAARSWSRRVPDPWLFVTVASAVIASAPLVAIFLTALQPASEIIRHIASTLLVRLMGNTVILILGVGTGTLILGVSLAWLTSLCDFPGRKLFSWALLLPMAVPTYVLAFTFIGLFDYAGPVQSFLRGASLPGLPDIRSPGGVVIVMSLALYPYVYLLARNAFRTQGRGALEAARSLGQGHFGGFFRVALPMARPWIVSGVMLVLMEALADFGAVSIFNFDTFTTAIYKAWFGFFSLPAAAKLSLPLILLAFTALTVEKRMRARTGFTGMGHSRGQAGHILLKSPWRQLASAYAGLVLSLAFILPAGQLLIWAIGSFAEEFDTKYAGLLKNTVLLGGISAALICLVSLSISYAAKRNGGRTVQYLGRISTLGYALPGTVLAVGVFMAVAGLDGVLEKAWTSLAGVSDGPSLRGTIIVMVTAYMIRFMAVGHSSIDSSMHRITRSIHETARVMGVQGLGLLRRIYLPILRGGILTGSIMVLVDVMKEMPITLMTRSFGMGTLATRIFELTSEGEWERAALPAITLIVTGLLPVFMLTKLSEEGGPSGKTRKG